ncbi:MAG: DUF4149 domain-containing protein [Verminephrobacter sp.]|nr:DUF4149 domain-containing protein [Verminephrobacter sp.]NUN61901.1 DUF4149 domain-containing protein [Burkholderiaceae bacterium]OGB48296.1 MAG: hypothetical protein A3F76_15750 [Burkholderiales bacterium RIFCSPLOWO2_12_FULL_65_40]
MAARFPAILAALWWGSLGAIGFMAVPLLFAHLPTPAMAGNMAAKLFAAQTWLSVACCMLLLLVSRPKGDVTLYPWARAATLFIVGGLLLALLVQFGVSPRIVARQDLKFWHGVGTLMYSLQWVCALITLWHTLRGPAAQPPAPAA